MNMHAITLVETPGSWDALMLRWLTSLDVSPRSQIAYKNSFMQFVHWIVKNNIQAPTRETVLAYKQWLDLEGLRPFTRAHYLVAMRRFFSWTESIGLYPNIMQGIKGVRCGSKHHNKDAFTPQNISKILGAIDTKTVAGLRDFALIFALASTGMRLIEVQRADIDDITYDGCPNGEALLWIRGKGKAGKDDFVVLTTSVLEKLKEYLLARNKHRPPKGRKKTGAPRALGTSRALFVSLSDRNFGQRMTIHSLSRIIKARLRFAGFDTNRLTAHSLRHTFGVLALKSGSSLYDVQLALRHSSPVTTEIYLGDIERQKRRESAPERAIQSILEKSLTNKGECP
ncbi:MAG: hypothetical protein UU47_C0003G0035 [candidate division TM6 bacterium GW2011_GWE2_41_16]|nr:MAG: hypothetical protein UU47_C0003G0035 [candidate division TM6 bacterium GW2011_GWE2_41_16]